MIPRELKAASSKPMILSILALEESYGYQIIKKIEDLSNGKWEWSEAMLYPVLHRLEADDLIKSRWEKTDSGRKRKYYSLTPKGEEALVTEQKQWLSVDRVLKELWKPNPGLSME